MSRARARSSRFACDDGFGLFFSAHLPPLSFFSRSRASRRSYETDVRALVDAGLADRPRAVAALLEARGDAGAARAALAAARAAILAVSAAPTA